MSEPDEGHQQIAVLFCSDRSRETKPSSHPRTVSISKYISVLGTNKNYGHGSPRDPKSRMTVLARTNSKLLPCSPPCSDHMNNSGNRYSANVYFSFEYMWLNLKLYAIGTLITVGSTVLDPDESEYRAVGGIKIDRGNQTTRIKPGTNTTLPTTKSHTI
jgi:hypothetical protein